MSIERKLVEFISHNSGISEKDIFLDGRLEQDYGITGDDAGEILDYMNTELGVNLSEMKFDQYFYCEGETFLNHIFNRQRLNHRKAFPVTVGHLVKVAELGRWYKPPQVKIF